MDTAQLAKQVKELRYAQNSEISRKTVNVKKNVEKNDCLIGYFITKMRNIVLFLTNTLIEQHGRDAFT